MYTSIAGIFENGQLVLLETPPSVRKSKVVITFLEEMPVGKPQKRKLGGLEGKISIPDDFNQPLDDLNDYMY